MSITNLAPILIAVTIITVIIGLLGSVDNKTWRNLARWFDKKHNYATALIGLFVATICGFAIAIPIWYGYDNLCEDSDWTGLHSTNDKEFWLFGDKVTVLCIDDENQTDVGAVKVIKKSQSTYGANFSSLA